MNNNQKAPAKKKSDKLSFFECYSQSMGMVIGAGIITSTGICLGFTGSGVWLAFILAGIVLLLGYAPSILGGSVMPKTSCSYFMCSCISPKIGGFYALMYFLTTISIGYMGVSFASYVASIIPVGNSKLLSIGVLTFFYLANYMDQKGVVKMQTFMNIFLITAWASFLIFGLGKVDWAVFNAKQMFPNGASGMFDAVATLSFAMGGALWLNDSGERIENPKRNVLLGNLAVTGTGMLLFAVIAVVAAGVLPLPEVVNQPLTLVAQAIYPGKSYLYFVFGGAIMALATTINARYLYAANALLKSGQEGWFPPAMAKLTKNKVPYVFMTIVWICSMLPILAGFDATMLSRLSATSTFAIAIVPNIGFLFMIKKYPEEWKASKYYMPKPVLAVFWTFCMVVLSAVIYYNMRGMTATIWLVFIAIVAAFFLYACVREKHVIKIAEAKAESKE